MTGDDATPPADPWSEWLLHDRHGDDPAYASVVQTAVAAFADRVLDAAHLAPGMTLADIGTGEGLVAFRAIERIGPTLKCVLTEVSRPMLRHAQRRALQREVHAQCTFHECAADRLAPLADASVDALTTRAVLAYVADKPAALREFFRVLKPGGRMSLCEPVHQDEAFYASALRRRVETAGAQPADRFLVLLHRWKAAQFPDTEEARRESPIANYSERDLVNFVRDSGFNDIHVQLEIDVKPALITSWEVFIASSPHPWAPPLRRILAEQFTPEEREFFERLVRPTVESGANTTTDRVVYVSATKPRSRPGAPLLPGT
jgi:ubiquinone/menaquinone biosynthesis C-methylase UbiE